MRKLRRAQERHAREQSKREERFKKRALAAGTAAVIALGAVAGVNKVLAAYIPDPHELPVSQDADADLLSNKEELAIGYRAFKADENRNGIPDGVELAKLCAIDINNLPWDNEADPNETYKWWSPQLGMHTCEICGATMPMGPGGVINPRLGISVSFDFLLALHYMEHGSFSYDGYYFDPNDPVQGRIDVTALLQALERRYPYEPNKHQLPLDYVVDSNRLAPDANDLDGDLLADSEELAAGYNPHDADQDKDLVPDGIELAKQCRAAIEELPWENEALPGETYKWWDGQYGMHTCDICGKTMPMGPGGVTNPQLGISVSFDFQLALHYMEHGSFSYDGNYAGFQQADRRIDVANLVKALEIPRHCGDLGTLYLPGDLNEDCKEDFTDFAEFADKWLCDTEPGQE
jgi:hypothetical protein